MPKSVVLGEFEQLVLLCLLRLDAEGHAIQLRRSVSEAAGRKVSRGALYRTLDRLEEKGWVSWELEEGGPARGGHPRRRYSVADAGIEVLRQSRRLLTGLWEGLEVLD